MVLSRAASRVAFDHVLDNVFERNDTSGLKQALLRNGISDVITLADIDQATIDGLTYDDTANNINGIAVVRGDKCLVTIFQDYVTARSNGSYSTPIADDEWDQITQEDFDSFRISPMYRSRRNTLIVPHATGSVPPSAVVSPISSKPRVSPAENFKRGIKKDQSLFPTLKDERFNDTWHRTFANQALAQDVSEILDDTYVPQDQDEIDLFIEKQKYMYAVLENKVMTDRGKAIVHEFESTHDAQKAYKKLKDHHTLSPKAKC